MALHLLYFFVVFCVLNLISCSQMNASFIHWRLCKDGEGYYVVRDGPAMKLICDKSTCRGTDRTGDLTPFVLQGVTFR